MICPFCAEKIKDEAVFCRYCKKDIKVIRSSSKSRNDGDNDLFFKLKDRITKSPFLIIIPVLLVIGFFGAIQYSAAQEQERIAAEQQRIIEEEQARIAAELEEQARAESDNSWVPEGFKKFSINPYVAYKKRELNSGECSYSKCLPITVVAKKDCPTLYIQSNSMQNEVILDWANDSVYGLVAGQQAEMVMLYSHNTSGTKTRFIEVNCY